MDVFKIVHLVDLDEVEPVPHKWEEDGIVYWPKTKKECRKKQSDVCSEPDKKNWMKLNGVVKAVERIYNDAVKAADLYADMSTDEAEEIRTSKPKRAKVTNSTLSYLNFFEPSETSDNASSSSASQILDEQYHPSVETVVTSTPNQEPETMTTNDSNISNEPSTLLSDVTFVNTTDLSKILEILNELKTNVTNVHQQMTALQQQVAEVRAKQDHFERLLSKNNDVALLNQRDQLSTQDRGKIFPLDSVKDLHLFEQQLATDEVYKAGILDHWKCIIGTSSRWKVAAYKLCGFLFTTNLLAKYSWTGISRLVETKETFQKLIEVLHLFYLVVKNADASFTIADRDNFFKSGVLKYGQSRLHPRKRSGRTEKNANVNGLNEAELGEGKKQEQNGAVDPEEIGAVEPEEIEAVELEENGAGEQEENK